MDPDEITPPPHKQKKSAHASDAAANVARAKLDSIYSHEPDAEQEQKEITQLSGEHLSKHQKYMQMLTTSGRDVAEVQTAWHEYYQSLNDQEKHEVWQEFYSTQSKLKQEEKAAQEASDAAEKVKSKEAQKSTSSAIHGSSHHADAQHRASTNTHKRKAASSKITNRRHKSEHDDHRNLTASSAIQLKRLRRQHHVKAATFGLSMGALVVFFLLFSFFNERFISPFIRPSGNVSATPIIVDPNSTGPVGPESKIIIPKINVEVPVIYDVQTIEEEAIQEGLERGVVHYPTTPNPGEIGNAVIFGHSSSNILNKGKYKFAFILLKSLEDEDTFIIQKDGKRYVYKVYNKYVTPPTDFSVLAASDKSIVTLITCDPPGTSTNRLIIQAEQIFPDPAQNKPSSKAQDITVVQPEQLPSNSVSMWQRIKNLF